MKGHQTGILENNGWNHIPYLYRWFETFIIRYLFKLNINIDGEISSGPGHMHEEKQLAKFQFWMGPHCVIQFDALLAIYKLLVVYQ